MAQKGETLVEVKDLCKNFGVTIALSHVDFVVKTGEIRGLIGENGSGKSTVSSIIAGMQPASSGEMLQGQTVETRYHAGSTESRYRHDRAGGRHNCKHLSS